MIWRTREEKVPLNEPCVGDFGLDGWHIFTLDEFGDYETTTNHYIANTETHDGPKYWIPTEELKEALEDADERIQE